MGRAGGFFKRLKSKRKREDSHRRRGTTGASKEARREKHNQLVDYYAARREADELAAISSSSEDQAGSSSSSSSSESDSGAGKRAEKPSKSLLKLRRLLGVKNDNKKRRNGNSGNAATTTTTSPDGENRNRKDLEDEGGVEGNGLVSGDDDELLPAEGGEDDWERFLPADDEEDDDEELEEEMEDDDDDDGEEEDEEEMEDEDAADIDDFNNEDDDEEEDDDDEDSGKEEAYVDEDHHNAAVIAAEEAKALLVPFQPGQSSADVLQSVVSPNDPFFVKYHRDAHGGIDRTPMAPLSAASNSAAAFGAVWSQLHPSEGVTASAHAIKNLQKPPRAVVKAAEAAAAGEVPEGDSAAAAQVSITPSFIHPVMWEKWVAFRRSQSKPALTAAEWAYLSVLQGYPDVLNCTRTFDNAEEQREIHMLHLLNHWFKCRSVVLAHDRILQHRAAERRRKRRQAKSTAKDVAESSKNNNNGPAGASSKKVRDGKKKKDNNDNKKSKAAVEAAEEHGSEEDEDESEDDDEDVELRDRGFGKTRLMIMLPMRNIALRYVALIANILGARPDQCRKLNVFESDFSEVEEAMDPTFRRRPKDYQRQFEGNIDDSFCFGLSLQPDKFQVYAHPLNSDILICSPLGLRKRVERNGDCLVSLSSLEVCLIDEAHVLLMQNWQHLTSVLEMINKRPTDTTSGLSDLRRVFAWALEGRCGRHRQTIIASEVTNATIVETFRTLVNNSGRVLIQHTQERGVLSRVMVPVRQHFLRFNTDSAQLCDDDRFQFFTRELYASRINPLVERNVRTIIFVPSYFDFVRLRNYLYQDYGEYVACISEYSSIKRQRRALGQFTDLERPLLLVTERFYFFKRYFVKLAEMLVFYSPPVFPGFYAHLVNKLVSTSPNASVMTTFSRYDAHELNRIVGTQRTQQMLQRESNTYSFITS